MRRTLLLTAVAALAGAATLPAQPAPGGPADRGTRGGPVDNTAEFLLAHTGDLNLTDAQVTRLAGIARRSAERRQALRVRLDSLRPQVAPGTARDSATRARLRQQAEQMRPVLDRMREQSQGDRRDALAVLTPDQQALAWERVATAGRGAGGARGGRGATGMGMGRRQLRPRGVGPDRMGPRGAPRPDDQNADDRRRPAAGRRPAEDR